MKNKVQLIAYADRLGGGNLADLDALLAGPLRGYFGGVHILPFFEFVDRADAGFDPVDHGAVDPRLGAWNDIGGIARRMSVMADLIGNHISSESAEFADYLSHGDKSPYREMFLTFDKVFPQGAAAQDLLAIHTASAKLPFTSFRRCDGSRALLWTTFTPRQIDLDVHTGRTREYLCSILRRFAANGVSAVRLDAVGYAVKRAGTSCLLIPESLAFIRQIAGEARELGMDVLAEIHGHFTRQCEVASHVDWVYDFALPPLVLHTLFSNNTAALKKWLAIRPKNTVTVLDTHDGIDVADAAADATDPARAGLLTQREVEQIVARIHSNSEGSSLDASGEGKSNIDVLQINCTYYDALGRVESDYLLARLIQFMTPGVPQVYYVGLLAGGNELALFRRTGVGRDINRAYYSREQVEARLQDEVVRMLLRLVSLRNEHAAFQGQFSNPPSDDESLHLRWQNGVEYVELSVHFPTRRFLLCYSRNGRAVAIDDWADILTNEPACRQHAEVFAHAVRVEGV